MSQIQHLNPGGKYDNYFKSQKQIPLGFIVPVIYRNQILDVESDNKTLVTKGDYLLLSDNYFTYTNIFDMGTKIENCDKMPDSLSDTPNKDKSKNAVDKFMENKASCLLADSSVNNAIEHVTLVF